MCVINYSATEEEIVIINSSLTVWVAISHWHCKPLHHTDYVRVQISRTVSASIPHWHFELTYLTECLSVHISLTAYLTYITDILRPLISLTLCTLICHLVWWLAHSLCCSVNAVIYPTWIGSLHHSLHTDSEGNSAKSLLNISRWLST